MLVEGSLQKLVLFPKELNSKFPIHSKLTIEETHVAIDVAVLVVVVLDGGVVVGDERLLDQLQRDGRLADAPIAHNNQLKDLIEMLLG